MMKKLSVFENETISAETVKTICDDLQRNKVEMLSFRNCKFNDKDYKRVMKAVGACTSLSLRHLGLSINTVCDSFRVQVLAQAIQRNASLVGLHLHGNRITDADFETLYPHMKIHPRILSLDLGDCNLGDEAMDLICNLIKEGKDTPGLHNLVLSHNPKITPDGWTKFGMALASGSGLRSLEIDYNNIGDSVACCIATALPGAAYLETLDMECTAVTDRTGQVLLHLVKSYKLKLKSVNLRRTQVLESTKEAIKLQLTNEQISDDECSLAMSEPPLDEHGGDGLGTDEYAFLSTNCIDPAGNITRTESFDTSGIPIVEISPSHRQEHEALQNFQLEEPNIKESTKSMSNIDANLNNLNAAGFEIKKAFSLNDLTGATNDSSVGIENGNDMKAFEEEYEAYIPDKESVKHRDSVATLVEDMERIEDLEHECDHSPSASAYSVKGIEDTDDTSKSDNPSPLFYTRPMSAPMSRNDTLNEASGLLQAKSAGAGQQAKTTGPSDDAVPTDLASLIRQRKEKVKEESYLTRKIETGDMEVQDIN